MAARGLPGQHHKQLAFQDENAAAQRSLHAAQRVRVALGRTGRNIAQGSRSEDATHPILKAVVSLATDGRYGISAGSPDEGGQAGRPVHVDGDVRGIQAHLPRRARRAQHACSAAPQRLVAHGQRDECIDLKVCSC